MAARKKKAIETPAPAPTPVEPEAVVLRPVGVGPRDPESLRVTARVGGAISMPWAPIALDGLLAWAVALREQLPPPMAGAPMHPIEIPVAREQGGRFHLASLSQQVVEERELRWINRRFPIPEAQAMAVRKFTRINIAAGAQKSYRLPLETQHLQDGLLTWWCMGDRAQIEELLSLVHYLGKKRSTGLGEVREWRVEPCEEWPGFPVLREGQPLRSLPVDWPGLAPDVDVQMRVLHFPYWDRTREVECAVPGAAA